MDNEASLYEESMNRFVEGLRETLEEQSQELITFNENGAMETNEFLNGVTATVTANADVILDKYEEVTPYMSNQLKQPWIDATAQLDTYGANLSKLNDWTSNSGYFGQFAKDASGKLVTPFSNGTLAVSTFQTSVSSAMGSIAKSVRSNVSNVTSYLGTIKSSYDGIITTLKTTEQAAKDAAAALAQKNAAENNTSESTVTATAYYGEYSATGTGLTTYLAQQNAKNALLDQMKADKMNNQGWSEEDVFTEWYRWTAGIQYRAKGSTGLKKDEWNITDEPEFGPELSMYATPQGTLSFMRAGSTVIPADLTKELMAIGEVGLDGLTNMPKFNSGVNIMSNAINKPEIKIDVAEFVHVDRVDKDTLPQLEAMVDKKINKLTKDLNYALKSVGGR